MTNTTEKHISLSEYWQGIHSALDAKLRSSKEYLRHPISGFSAEDYFRELLRRYLPGRYAVDTGFVVNAEGERSDHIDIIVADTFHIPPLCSEPNYKVFAVESVCAVIEITTSPKGKVKKVPKFENDIVKLGKAREMGRIREYIDIKPVMVEEETQYLPTSFGLRGCPRAFLITSGEEWKKKETYENHLVASLREAKNKGNSPWINAALSMSHGMLHFVPHKEYETNWITKDPLLEFLLLLNDSVSTFETFKIDIRRYRDTIPKL